MNHGTNIDEDNADKCITGRTLMKIMPTSVAQPPWPHNIMHNLDLVDLKIEYPREYATYASFPPSSPPLFHLDINELSCLHFPHRMDNMNKVWVISSLLLCFTVGGLAEQCGTQAGGATCPGGLCCSQWGWCGCTNDYCGTGCQSQCDCPHARPDPLGSVADIISRDTFNQMLKHRDDGACPARGFYTYDAFIQAAKSFQAFATTGDTATRKREVAAFLGQTSHETTGGWPTAPDGPYAWGYCFNRERTPSDYCSPSAQYPCAKGKQYYGRGPIQLSWNYNYGAAGRAIGVDLLNNPDLVATDPVISFKTALWFWMTPQSPKPSCHDVITGRWTPSGADNAAGRLSGYGTVTNIINGGLECGRGRDARVEDRIGFYKRYCDLLRVGYGDNLDCHSQRPFGFSSLIDII